MRLGSFCQKRQGSSVNIFGMELSEILDEEEIQTITRTWTIGGLLQPNAI